MFKPKHSKTSTIKIARLIIKRAESKKLNDEDYNEIQRLLPSTNVNSRMRPFKNDTLMHLAVRMNLERLLEMFLNENGDVMIINGDRESVLDLAKKLKYEKIIEIIERKLEQINAGIVQIKDNECDCVELKTQIKLYKEEFKYLKVIKVTNIEEFFAINENVCDIFPNLFAINIDCIQDNDKSVILDNMSKTFKDNRPMLVHFTQNSSYFFRQINSKNFANENSPEFKTVYQLIHNQKQTIDIRKEIIEKNDIFAMRFLKIFKVTNDHKLVMDSIQFGSFEIFLSSLYVPFNQKQEDFIPEIANILTKVFENDQSILKFTITNKSIEVFNFLVENFKNFYSLLPFDHKMSIVNLAVDKNLYEFLLRLLNIDFPFPDNINTISNDNIISLQNEREILHGNDINAIKSFVEILKSRKDSFIRVGFDTNNHSALYTAVKCNNYRIYGFLISIGFICKDNEEEKEISKLINELSEENQNKIKEFIGLENIRNAKLDRRRFLMKLATKFAIYGFYDNDSIYDEKFNLILNYLIELSEINDLNLLFEFCEQIENLKIGIDFENDDLTKFEPSSDDSCGVSYFNSKLVFVASKNRNKIIETIVHELLHIALEYYYENDGKPYFEYDVEREKEFKGIILNIQDMLKENPNDDCNGIISNILNYDEEEYEEEFAVRSFEMLVAYKDDEEKLKKLKGKYEKLFTFSEKYITKAMKIDEGKNRFKIRKLNKYIGLLQNCEESFLRLSKHKKRTDKLKKILKSKNNCVIASNIPILTLIELKNYLKASQYSLFDAINIFIKPSLFENEQIFMDFKSISNIDFKTFEDISSNIIVDFSQNINIRAIQNKLKTIFITSLENIEKVKKILNENEVSYDDNILNYSFNDLTQICQENLLKTQVKFQEKCLPLSRIINENFMQEEEANELLIDLCNDNLISLNSTKIFPDNYFIERNFILYPQEAVSVDFLKIPPTKINQTQSIETVFDPVSKNLNVNVHIKQELEYDTNKFLQLIENEKVILISDIGGSGKSRILKKLFNIFFVSSTDKWIIFINLREYLKEIQNSQENFTFLNFFDLFLSKNLKQVESKIFHKFYKHGNVKILMDGFDEISPKCNEKVLKIIKSLKDGKTYKNQLWVSTRKHLEIDLQKILDTKTVFYLKPLDRKEQKEFLIKYWKFKNVNKYDLEKSATDFVTKFSKFQSQKGNFIGIMQQLKILADISINNDDFTSDSIENLTMYEIYEYSVLNYIKIWQNTPIGRDEDRKTHQGLKKLANFQTVHQFYALLEHLDENVVNKFFKNEGKIWDLEAIARGGIITYTNATEKAIFIHATYVDYFTANFLLQALDNEIEIERFAQFFLETLCDWQRTTIQMFINDKIEEVEISKDNIECFAKIIDNSSRYDWLASSVINNYHKNFDFLIKIIDKLSVEKKNKNISPQLILCVNRDFIDEKMFDKILNLFFNFDNQTFIESIKTGTANDFPISHHFYKTTFSLKMMKKLMTEIIEKSNGNKNVVQEIILGKLMTPQFASAFPIITVIVHAQENDFEKFEYFWKLHEKFLDCDTMVKYVYENILISISLASNGKIFDFIFKKIKAHPKLKFAIMIEENLIDFAKNIRMDIHKTLWKYLKTEENEGNLKIEKLMSKFYENQNYLQLLVSTNPSDEILNFTIIQIMENIENYMNILMSVDKRKMNLLHLSLYGIRQMKFMETLFKLLFELCGSENFKKLVLDLNCDGESLFTMASRNSTIDVFNLIYFYLKDFNLNLEEYKTLIADGRNGSKYKNFLILPLLNNISLDVHIYFWKLAENLFQDNLKRFITEKINKKGNLLSIAVEFNTIEIIDFVWSKIKIVLPNRNAQKKYLKSAGGKKTNLYEIALNQSRYNSVFWVEKTFNEYGI